MQTLTVSMRADFAQAALARAVPSYARTVDHLLALEAERQILGGLRFVKEVDRKLKQRPGR